MRAWPSPPAERERTTHQLPVVPHGQVASHLVVGRPQGVLYLFVALLYPATQCVEPAHFCQVRRPWLSVSGLAFPFGARQVGEQVERGEIRQRGGIGSGDHQTLAPPCSEGPALGLEGPPSLGVPVAKGTFEEDRERALRAFSWSRRHLLPRPSLGHRHQPAATNYRSARKRAGEDLPGERRLRGEAEHQVSTLTEGVVAPGSDPPVLQPLVDGEAHEEGK